MRQAPKYNTKKANTSKPALPKQQQPRTADSTMTKYQDNSINVDISPISSMVLQKGGQKQNDQNVGGKEIPTTAQKTVPTQEQPTVPTANQVDQKPKKSPYLAKRGFKNKPDWETSCHHRFIQYWQAVFNRRVISFSCFALQVGDIVIFTLVVAFLVFSCLQETDTQSSGSMAQVMLGVTVIFGCRNGLLSYIFGLSIERAVLWHQLMAWITLGLGLNHMFHSDSIMSGYLVLGPIIGLVAFSIKPVRRYLWEVFMRMHWLLIIVLLVGCIAHGVTFGVIAIGYFFLDIFYRIYTVCKHRHMSANINLERVGTNITKITIFNEECFYKGGQYFFIMIPELSYFQWHPFSIFSASDEEEMVFYVKCLGDWTNELYRIAGRQGRTVSVRGYLDGPYGHHSISINGDKYKNFLLIAGGIGITPIISTAKELLSQMEDGRPVKNLHFVWTGRDSAIIENVLAPDDLKSLITQDESRLLRTFYHYSNSGDKKLADIEKNAEKNKQELVEITKGRPNFDKIFDIAYKSAEKSGYYLVAVLCCGPQELIDQVETDAMKWSGDGVRFDVHQEVFNF